MKKILIIGSKGMLGQELVKIFFGDKNYKVIAWDREEIDITDEAQVKEKIGQLKPDIIINAAAYNAVDKAEEPREFELAKKLNGLAPGYLARAAKDLTPHNPPLQGGQGTIFVHYSSDYVFNGENPAGYKEDDCPSPISNYGKSKLLGEQKIQEIGGRFYIIRLQKLFGRPAKSSQAKKSFFEVILNLAQTKKELEMVDEELANFTFAPDLAERTKLLVESATPSQSPPFKGGEKVGVRDLVGIKIYPFGIYHITNEGQPVTWFGAANILFELAQQCHPKLGLGSQTLESDKRSRNEFGMTDYSKIKLVPVSASKFPRPARRPKYVILLNTKLPPLRPWPEALKEFLEK